MKTNMTRYLIATKLTVLFKKSWCVLLEADVLQWLKYFTGRFIVLYAQKAHFHHLVALLLFSAVCVLCLVWRFVAVATH